MAPIWRSQTPNQRARLTPPTRVGHPGGLHSQARLGIYTDNQSAFSRESHAQEAPKRPSRHNNGHDTGPRHPFRRGDPSACNHHVPPIRSRGGRRTLVDRRPCGDGGPCRHGALRPNATPGVRRRGARGTRARVCRPLHSRWPHVHPSHGRRNDLPQGFRHSRDGCSRHGCRHRRRVLPSRRASGAAAQRPRKAPARKVTTRLRGTGRAHLCDGRPPGRAQALRG